MYLSTYLSICLSIYLSIYLSTYLPIYLSTYLPTYLSIYLIYRSIKTKIFCETSSIFELNKSKTKQLCETASFFKVGNIKNEAILRDLLQKWKVACSADGLVPMRCAIFPVHLSKLLRLPGKSDARSYEVLHLSRKIISANLKI